MDRIHGNSKTKSTLWVGTSRKDLAALPSEVKRCFSIKAQPNDLNYS
jgi:phage-related protein